MQSCALSQYRHLLLLLFRVNINNTNDAPFVSLNGSDPVIFSLGAEFREGSQALAIVPRLQVIDVDPDAMIQR